MALIRLNTNVATSQMIRISLLLLVSTVLFASTSFGKGNVKPGPASSAQIIESLEKLNVLGSVLYIAAHPDDETVPPLCLDCQSRAGSTLIKPVYWEE